MAKLAISERLELQKLITVKMPFYISSGSQNLNWGRKIWFKIIISIIEIGLNKRRTSSMHKIHQKMTKLIGQKWTQKKSCGDSLSYPECNPWGGGRRSHPTILSTGVIGY